MDVDVGVGEISASLAMTAVLVRVGDRATVDAGAICLSVW